jgi:hypothetical protein
MPELTQGMIDAGAVTIDANGIPTKADGSPIAGWELSGSRGGGPGILETISQQAFTPTQPGPANTENPVGYAFGPPYTPSPQDYPEGRAPLDPGFGADPGQLQMSDTGVPLNWKDFATPEDKSTGGGFFTAKDVFGDNPVPWAFGGENPFSLPSTNNYRLLPPGFNTPNFVMRGGQIINLNGNMYGPQGGATPEHTAPRWRSGTNLGWPVAYSSSPIGWGSAGWPGQMGNYQFWNASD